MEELNKGECKFISSESRSFEYSEYAAHLWMLSSILISVFCNCTCLSRKVSKFDSYEVKDPRLSLLDVPVMPNSIKWCVPCAKGQCKFTSSKSRSFEYSEYAAHS